MKMVITGGSGFIGSRLAEYFSGLGNDITVFDSLSRKGSEKNLEDLRGRGKINFVKGDVRDFDALKGAIKDCDAVFHCAAQVAVTTSVKKPREDFEVNALGTFNVLEAARLAKTGPSVIFTSTNKVYGNGVNNIQVVEEAKRYRFGDNRYSLGVPETFPTDDKEHSPYGCSKYAADLYVRDYSCIYGIPSVVFRMSCIYGEGQFGTEDQGWLAHFIISSLLNRNLTIYGDGKQVRDVLYVNDLARAFELTSKNARKLRGEAFNIGGGPDNTLSLIELIEMIEKLSKKKIKYSFDVWRPGDQKVYVSDIRKAKSLLGWEPVVSPDDGVRKLFTWIEKNLNLFV